LKKGERRGRTFSKRELKGGTFSKGEGFFKK